MTKTGTILIVEDHDDLRESFADFLGDEGYEALTAPHGETALHALSERPVDVLITDLQMPVLDGEALIRETRKRGLSIPVILMSANSEKLVAARNRLEAGGIRVAVFDKTSDPLSLAAMLAVLVKQ